MKKKFNVGEIVFATSHPAQKLIICESIIGYYCKEVGGPGRTPQIRFEKELFNREILPFLQKPAPFAAPIKKKTITHLWKLRAVLV